MTEFNSCPDDGLTRETKESLSGVSRRHFLTKLAIAAGSIGLSSISFPALADSKKLKICATKDINVGGASSFWVREKKVFILITQPKSGVFRAFDQKCTHNSANRVGEVMGKNLVCKSHGSQFDMESGSLRKGPARKPLQRFDVSVEKKFIYVTFKD